MLSKEQARKEGCGPKKYDHIVRELLDLGVERGSYAWSYVGNEAIHAAEIMTTSQLTQLIEDHLDDMPLQTRENIGLRAL